MTARRLKVGDLCVTVGTDHPVLNDGLLVVIIGFNPTIKSHTGESTPWHIRRIDGQAFPSTTVPSTGAISLFKCTGAFAVARKLKRVDGTGRDAAAGARKTKSQAKVKTKADAALPS